MQSLIRQQTNSGFNRYIVECKFIKKRGDIMKGYSFNRYIVECKSGFQEIDEDLGGVLIDT